MAIKADDPITMKISRDGAKFSKSSNIILLSFSLPGFQQAALSGAGMQHNPWRYVHVCTLITGNYTFAAAQENYDTLSSDMNDVMKSINSLTAKPEVTISGNTYTMDIIMGTRYVVLSF